MASKAEKVEVVKPEFVEVMGSPGVKSSPMKRAASSTATPSTAEKGSKWKSSYDSKRRYQFTWEERFAWVAKAHQDLENAFCTVCRKTMLPKLSVLQNHDRSVEHRKKFDEALRMVDKAESHKTEIMDHVVTVIDNSKVVMQKQPPPPTSGPHETEVKINVIDNTVRIIEAIPSETETSIVEDKENAEGQNETTEETTQVDTTMETEEEQDESETTVASVRAVLNSSVSHNVKEIVYDGTEDVQVLIEEDEDGNVIYTTQKITPLENDVEPSPSDEMAMTVLDENCFTNNNDESLVRQDPQVIGSQNTISLRPDKTKLQTVTTASVPANVDPKALLRTAAKEIDDAPQLLEIVGSLIYEKLSIWDLLMGKSLHYAETSGNSPMENVLMEFEQIIVELKELVENCYDHVNKVNFGRGERLKRKAELGIDVSETVAKCIEVKSGYWKRKDKVKYQSPIFTASKAQEDKFRALIKAERENQSEGEDEGSDSEEEDEDKENSSIKEESPAKRLRRGRREKDDEDFDIEEHRLKEKEEIKIVPRGRGRPPLSSGGPSKKKLKTRFKCDKCGKVYKFENSLQKHEKSCSKLLRYFKEGINMFCAYPECPDPGRKYTSKEKLLEHFCEHHFTPEDYTIECSYGDCKEKFPTVSLRNAHVRRSHEKMFVCPKCPKKFWEQKALEEHVMKLHAPVVLAGEGEEVKPKVTLDKDGKENVMCPKCGKMLTKTYLPVHETKCDGLYIKMPQYKKVNDEFICTVEGCSISHGFNCMYGLRVHFYETHVEEHEKMYPCDYCDQKFSTRIQQTKHIKLSHIKAHQCDHCGRRFGTKAKLASHVLTHTGEKPFDCDRCDYRTAKKYNLDEHKQKKHGDLGGRNYYCNLCGKVFVTPGRLTSHYRIVHEDGKNPEGRKAKKHQRAGIKIDQKEAQLLAKGGSGIYIVEDGGLKAENVTITEGGETTGTPIVITEANAAGETMEVVTDESGQTHQIVSSGIVVANEDGSLRQEIQVQPGQHIIITDASQTAAAAAEGGEAENITTVDFITSLKSADEVQFGELVQ